MLCRGADRLESASQSGERSDSLNITAELIGTTPASSTILNSLHLRKSRSYLSVFNFEWVVFEAREEVKSPIRGGSVKGLENLQSKVQCSRRVPYIQGHTLDLQL